MKKYIIYFQTGLSDLPFSMNVQAKNEQHAINICYARQRGLLVNLDDLKFKVINITEVTEFPKVFSKKQCSASMNIVKK